MGSNPSKFNTCGDDCPVERVSWNDAQEFIRRLNQKTGKTYRLPSDAEWEYACHAGKTNKFCGSEKIDSVAWYDSNSGKKTHAVASKQPNAWGLYDMTGNVWEWTQDCYNQNDKDASGEGNAAMAHDCKRHTLRGGSWGDFQRLANSANRGKYSAKSRAYDVVSRRSDFGLRLAATLP
jgi:formylglycine-generating enzyme required for sulfatase activity